MRRVASLALVALAALASGCGHVSGGGGPRAAPDDVVARVGSDIVAFRDVQAFMAEIRRSFEAQKKTFPDQGTPEYANLEAQAIERLAERLATTSRPPSWESRRLPRTSRTSFPASSRRSSRSTV